MIRETGEGRGETPDVGSLATCVVNKGLVGAGSGRGTSVRFTAFRAAQAAPRHCGRSLGHGMLIVGRFAPS